VAHLNLPYAASVSNVPANGVPGSQNTLILSLRIKQWYSLLQGECIVVK